MQALSNSRAKTLLLAICGTTFACGVLASTASAQTTPAQPPPQSLQQPGPQPLPGPHQHIGFVVAARPFEVQVRTRDGRYVELQLHTGTIINPRGITLRPGMRVAYMGTPRGGGTVATDEVDVLPRRAHRPGFIPPPGAVPPPPGAEVPPPAPPGNPPPQPSGGALPPPPPNTPPRP